MDFHCWLLEDLLLHPLVKNCWLSILLCVGESGDQVITTIWLLLEFIPLQEHKICSIEFAIFYSHQKQILHFRVIPQEIHNDQLKLLNKLKWGIKRLDLFLLCFEHNLFHRICKRFLLTRAHNTLINFFELVLAVWGYTHILRIVRARGRKEEVSFGATKASRGIEWFFWDYLWMNFVLNIWLFLHRFLRVFLLS